MIPNEEFSVPDLPTTRELALDLDRHVLTIMVNRAEHRNTVTCPVLDELLAAFAFAEACDDVRAVVLTGSGDCFSHGTDLRAADGYAAGAADFKPLRGGTRDIGGELAIRIYNSTRPVIAAVNGTAVGIGITFVRRESSRNPAALGSCRGSWASPPPCTGFPPRARSTRPRRCDAGWSRKRSRGRPARQLMWRGLSVAHPMTANELESRALQSLGRAPDAREGVQSFLEKRTPEFPTPLSQIPSPYPWWQEPPFEP
jgi:enoyl-CoA hydratase/carnithine racemase